MNIWKAWRRHHGEEAEPMLESRERSIDLTVATSKDVEPAPQPTRNPSLLATLESPFENYNLEGAGSNVNSKMWTALTKGSEFQELIEASPGDVITVLRDLAVVNIGSFEVSDEDVLKAFGRNRMLTRGCDTVHDPEWETHWRQRIEELANGCSRPVSVGWQEMVRVDAYAVNIRDLAARGGDSLLSLLLQKCTSGAAPKRVWDFAAVRAVVNYHWEYWARTFMIIQFMLFLGWIVSVTAYIALYIECDLTPKEDNPVDPSYKPFIGGISNILAVACLLFMCPFVYLEYRTAIEQGRRWFQYRNIIDVGVIALQILTFCVHMTSEGLVESWFGAVLATHCVLMFTKMQNFGRVLGMGSSFVETVIAVMYDVRYFIGFILMTLLSTALCLGALFKHDDTYNKDNDEFNSLGRSFVTTFAISFGQFDVDYVFLADYPWVKAIFFFLFQMLMNVTILNLLIAVMTESYSAFAQDQRIRYNMGRADIIDELELLRIPSLFAKDPPPFIHYLTIGKKAPPQTSSMMPRSNSIDELKKEVKRIADNLQQLMTYMTRASQVDDSGRPPRS